jgi:hypothetical protein
MNNLVVNQVGGFPMTTRILDEIQKAHAIFNGYGDMIGNMTIVSGCVIAGTTVGNGVVYLNGELFEFRGGNVQTKVIIKEDVELLTFQNGNANPVIKTRYVTFGTGVGAILWTDFKRIDTIVTLMARLDTLEKKTAVFQSGGGMLFWNKLAADIPAGWQEVVDWRGRMPVGFDATQPEFNAMGKTGGSKSKTLTVGNLPKHKFTYQKAKPGRGYRTASDSYPFGEFEDAQSNEVGNDESFSILNPYRVVMFIEYIS